MSPLISSLPVCEGVADSSSGVAGFCERLSFSDLVTHLDQHASLLQVTHENSEVVRSDQNMITHIVRGSAAPRSLIGPFVLDVRDRAVARAVHGLVENCVCLVLSRQEPSASLPHRVSFVISTAYLMERFVRGVLVHRCPIVVVHERTHPTVAALEDCICAILEREKQD